MRLLKYVLGLDGAEPFRLVLFLWVRRERILCLILRWITAIIMSTDEEFDVEFFAAVGIVTLPCGEGLHAQPCEYVAGLCCVGC